jgi:hypothetical protein
MKNSEEARDRFYREVGIRLAQEGFSVLEQKDGLLPIEWNGASLCRITAGGGAQFRREELEPDGAGDAFHLATEIAHTTAEYLSLMETSPPLQAKELEGDYRLLADFNGTVLAGHPTAQGVEFVTWEWDYSHTGMWQGHYYGNNYPGAKQDFAIRAGLIPKELILEQSELDEFYHCCQRTRELDETLTYQDEQRIIKAQERIEFLAPGVQERVAAMEPQQPQFEQAMF